MTSRSHVDPWGCVARIFASAPPFVCQIEYQRLTQPWAVWLCNPFMVRSGDDVVINIPVPYPSQLDSATVSTKIARLTLSMGFLTSQVVSGTRLHSFPSYVR